MSWLPGDVSNSQILTPNDHLYAGHINELRAALDASLNDDQIIFGVKDFREQLIVPDNNFPISSISGLITALGNKANDNAVLHKALVETITDVKTFNAGTFWDKGSRVHDVRAYGAKLDLVYFTDGAMTSGSAVFTSALSLFSASDVGKTIEVPGAGAGGTYLITTIQSYNSPTQVTLAIAASVTVSAVIGFYGTNDSAAYNACVTAMNIIGGAEMFVPGKSLIVGNINLGLKNRITITGIGVGVSVLQHCTQGAYAETNSIFHAGSDLNTYITIKGMTLRGDKHPNEAHGMNINQTRFFTAENVLVTNMGTYGFVFSAQSFDVRYKNCWSNGNGGMGFFFGGSSTRLIAENCWSENNGGGIHAVDQQGFFVDGNAGVGTPTSEVDFINCHAKGNMHDGFYITDVSKVRMSNITAEDNTWKGVSVTGTSFAPGRHYSLSNVQVYGTHGDKGVQIGGAEIINLSNVSAEGCALQGVYISSGNENAVATTKVSLNNVTGFNNGGAGVEVFGDTVNKVSNLTINGGTLEKNVKGLRLTRIINFTINGVNFASGGSQTVGIEYIGCSGQASINGCPLGEMTTPLADGGSNSFTSFKVSGNPGVANNEHTITTTTTTGNGVVHQQTGVLGAGRNAWQLFSDAVQTLGNGLARIRIGNASSTIPALTIENLGSGADIQAQKLKVMPTGNHELKNTTAAPTVSLADGGILYVEGGALKYRGQGGTVTVIGPS